MKIGITERGDAALDTSWLSWIITNEPLILITKNPYSLHLMLEKAELYSYNNFIVHCTITGMGGSVLEPNVIKPKLALEGYKNIWTKIGRGRTVLRIDPIIPTDKGIETAYNVILKCETRVRISFLDMYPHVINRFKEKNIPIPYTSFHAPFELRKKAFNKLNNLYSTTGFEVEICGEPDFICTGCVSKEDFEALRIDYNPTEGGKQRQYCCCIAEKYELLSNKSQCEHKCLYCYWR